MYIVHIHYTLYSTYICIAHISGGLNHLPYLLSTSVSLAVIKDFSTKYMTDFGLNQAYTRCGPSGMRIYP